MIDLKERFNDKNVLIVGVGKWAKTMTKVFLNKDWNVYYATRDGKLNLKFEKHFSSQKLKNFDLKKKLQFDLVSICVKPIDIYPAWEKYKCFSDKFLIEKPGANTLE